MRVLHVIPTLILRHGGADRACAELCESLAAEGLDVSIAYLHEPEDREFEPRGVKLHPCRRSRSRLGKAYAYSREMGRLLRSLVADHDLLHIHAVWNYPTLAAARVAEQASVPYIVQPHGSLHPWGLRHHRLRKWLHGELVERRLLNRATAVHAETEEDRGDILNYAPGAQVFVVPCGVFPDRLLGAVRWRTAGERWPGLNGKRLVLYLGRLDVNKGLDILLEAFSVSIAQSGKFVLFVAGPDHAGILPRLQRMAERLGVGQYVFWAGMITGEKKRLALQTCDFFVLPSLSENFGISVLEAMCCGKPVITTTATPWGMLEEHGAGRVVPPTVEGLANAFRELADLPVADLKAMGARARALVLPTYDWRVIARRMLGVYVEIFERQGASRQCPM